MMSCAGIRLAVDVTDVGAAEEDAEDWAEPLVVVGSIQATGIVDVKEEGGVMMRSSPIACVVVASCRFCCCCRQLSPSSLLSASLQDEEEMATS